MRNTCTVLIIVFLLINLSKNVYSSQKIYTNLFQAIQVEESSYPGILRPLFVKLPQGNFNLWPFNTHGLLTARAIKTIKYLEEMPKGSTASPITMQLNSSYTNIMTTTFIKHDSFRVDGCLCFRGWVKQSNEPNYRNDLPEMVLFGEILCTSGGKLYILRD